MKQNHIFSTLWDLEIEKLAQKIGVELKSKVTERYRAKMKLKTKHKWFREMNYEYKDNEIFKINFENTI